MIEQTVEYLSILLILTNLALLGSSRLGVCVKVVSLQGVVLALIPALREWGHIGAASLALCAITLTIKGWIFPRLLLRAVERSGIRREIEPLVGYNASLLIGSGMLVFAFWLQKRLPLIHGGGLLAPAAYFAILSGFFITIARRKALTQILGYLALENGIFAFGAAALPEHPLLLEMGILLDLFVGVLIMGIAIFHISQEYDHIDADRLDSLRDGGGETA